MNHYYREGYSHGETPIFIDVRHILVRENSLNEGLETRTRSLLHLVFLVRS